MQRSLLFPSIILLLTAAASAVEPGWHISPLAGEGDRASLGCSRDSTDTDFACLAVRCEDDYSVGIHVHSSRLGGTGGRWTMTVDREDRAFTASEAASPYGTRLIDDGWLLDRIRHGTFIYLRHAEDDYAAFHYIDLSGSYRAVEEALFWCAPRVAPGEQNTAPNVTADSNMEKPNEPSPARTQ